jgi:uncharacterized protein (DUF2252 family)
MIKEPRTIASSRKTKARSAKAAPSFRHHASHADLYKVGQQLRNTCSRGSHAVWKPPHDRPDPLHFLNESSRGRIPHLIPIRYGRMLQSPFSFYRGAALSMAADLSGTPTPVTHVQACGDCHMMNFGGFASPERRVVFDINDLDETLPAPWEWDVKRLAASFVLACRENSFSASSGRESALACVRSYRERMAELSTLPALEIWYASTDVEQMLKRSTDQESKQRLQKRLVKARRQSALEHQFPELVTGPRSRPTIKDQRPLIYHEPGQGIAVVHKAFAEYRESLPEHRRVLLDRFQVVDVAVKVVGVGSVGTACFVILLMASEEDPLFLQIKEARPSVLERYAGKSKYSNHGQRVVVGCQLMQSASDIFLGWTSGGAGRSYFIRQLKDMKLKPLVNLFTPGVMQQYAMACGAVLARAHARTGEPATLSGYLGKNDKFDEAIADFSVLYADQSERDHSVLMKAVRQGKLEVANEEP